MEGDPAPVGSNLVWLCALARGPFRWKGYLPVGDVDALFHDSAFDPLEIRGFPFGSYRNQYFDPSWQCQAIICICQLPDGADASNSFAQFTFHDERIPPPRAKIEVHLDRGRHLVSLPRQFRFFYFLV